MLPKKRTFSFCLSIITNRLYRHAAKIKKTCDKKLAVKTYGKKRTVKTCGKNTR